MLPISLPGFVDGLFDMRNKLGKLSMQKNLQDVINCANNGFPLKELIAYDWGYWVLEILAQNILLSAKHLKKVKHPKPISRKYPVGNCI
jgi:gamma-glutamyltranspeptidase